MASKNELLASRTVLLLRRIVTSSPASSSPTICPSAFKKVVGTELMVFTRMVADSGRIMERFESACGQIGVSANTSAVGKTIAPPAASEYAVEPVGELTIKPSQR